MSRQYSHYYVEKKDKKEATSCKKKPKGIEKF